RRKSRTSGGLKVGGGLQPVRHETFRQRSAQRRIRCAAFNPVIRGSAVTPYKGTDGGTPCIESHSRSSSLLLHPSSRNRTFLTTLHTPTSPAAPVGGTTSFRRRMSTASTSDEPTA